MESLSLAYDSFTTATLVVPNAAPIVTLPGPHSIAVDATSSFSVTAHDPGGDLVTLMNTVAPVGATFTNGVFTWTATLAGIGRSKVVRFLADDQRGAPNRVVSASTAIIVPRDFDADQMDDDYGVIDFGDPGGKPDEDADRDGKTNLEDFLANTEPANPLSVFRVPDLEADLAGFAVRCTTAPRRRYTVQYSDDCRVWKSFANAGVGVFQETGEAASTHIFLDDFGDDTSAGTPPAGRRFYRVFVDKP